MPHSKNNSAGSFGDESLPGIRDVTMKLLRYCHANDWAGYDPYDALNSRLFEALPFLDLKPFRLALTQALKRFPFNLRRLLLVPKTKQSKGLALCLISLLKLRKLNLVENDDYAQAIIERLMSLRSPDSQYWCWGYNFPWQTRTIRVPRGAPNLVCTTFVADALLNAYDELGELRLLEMAVSAGDYVLNELYYTEGDGVASFCYPLPAVKAKIHNANFLAAALLSRLYRYTADERLREPALRAARYSAAKQQQDGAWYYGELPTQRWIDNFHTGYNLTSLRAIGHNLRTSEFDFHVQRGFTFYRKHFFREDGAVRYFHNETYPIDIHCVAQSLLTLSEFRDLDPSNTDLIQSVYAWVMNHVRSDEGFFYYRVLRTVTIRTSYMRWSQSWMLLALTTLLASIEGTRVVKAAKFSNRLVVAES
jgi:hypothetical protein